MNWLMWGKMFSYFYNKISPVNLMHYIKRAVNSSLLTLLWLLQKVCGTLDPCFITAHSICKEGDLQISFGVMCIPWNKAPRTGPRHIWRTYRLFAFFGLEKNTDGTGDVWKISYAIVYYEDCRVPKHLLQLHLVFRPIWGWGNLSSFQLPQSNSSPEGAWTLCRYI